MQRFLIKKINDDQDQSHEVEMEPEDDRFTDYLKNHSSNFYKGYIKKKVHLKNLILEGINHTIQELKFYH